MGGGLVGMMEGPTAHYETVTGDLCPNLLSSSSTQCLPTQITEHTTLFLKHLHC